VNSPSGTATTGDTKATPDTKDGQSTRPSRSKRMGGSMGNVRAAQEALKAQGFDPGEIDGLYGPHTRAAVANYQRTNGLRETGQFDQATRARLGVESNGNNGGSSPVGGLKRGNSDRPMGTERQPGNLSGGSPAADPSADNSGKNVRDRQNSTMTPGDQSNAKSDMAITQAIRKAVVADKGLSTNAHNVKIITKNGVVTLRGPVKTAEEKNTIAAKAEGAAGVKSVDNQLEIASR
jgi:peptidoglycan hydrolase-like protein with peptidoglycan-binding domain